ncbi:hypothetical protein OGAPHI_003607 [Ogataea philodendri]|uniref:HTH APSES-type domain-containing protein n=1 Tax=Ogataea philodendri TaxID=1378263 RepID=A0A9P8P413_9ASCO|nr:uncharacterized protein OGAPHI_003607 [Ogataea philodendri]KAH3665423.1 hypothetical protein OGAPHI_003607 [Ogataea philodendri]
MFKVDVIESTVNGIPLMRRCDDDWVNATQILKIAGFGKAQRTRLLEREVHQFKHQKIQGGYGRFQGTWVPLDFARELAESHKIPRENAKVLYYDPQKDQPLEKKTKTRPTPSASDPKKRKLKVETNVGYKPSKKMSPNAKRNSETSFPQIPHAPPTFGNAHTYQTNSPQQMLPMTASPYAFPTAHQQYSMKAPSYYNVPTFHGSTPFPHQGAIVQHNQYQPSPVQRFSHHYNNFGSLSTTDGSQDELRLNRSNSDTSTSSGFDSELKNPPHLAPNDPYRQQDSFAQHHYNIGTPSMGNILTENHEMEGEDYDYYTEKLLSFFGNDDEPIPDFILNPPRDFDINKAIDDEGHTPLHWASALASHPVVQELISKNANPLILNNAGMNSLSKLIHFTNSYDLRNFGVILQLLRQCLIVPDAQGRTPLHYIMELSSNPNKVNCLTYYFDEIVKFIEFQQNEAEKVANGSKADKDLLRILVNHQDKNGNTALHLALRGSEKSFVQRLIQLGADVNLVGLYNIPASIVEELHLSDGSVSVESQQSKFKEPATYQLDVSEISENKENVFEDNSTVSNYSRQGGNKDDAMQLLKFETPKMNDSMSDGVFGPSSFLDSIRFFESKFAATIESLNTSITNELGIKDEELSHNLQTMESMETEIQQLTKKMEKLYEELLRDSDEQDRELLQNSEFNPVTVQKILDKYTEKLHMKHEQLINMYERSQALELAKLVHHEETQITGPSDGEGPVKNVQMAVNLTSLQLDRRNVIGSITASISGISRSDEEDSNSIDLEEKRTQAKLYLYRKLISNICNLPFDEIDEELVSGIEMRLLKGKTAT